MNLVTGASDYIGRSLVRKMVKIGMGTRAFVRRTSDIKSLMGLKNIEIRFGDITDFFCRTGG